MKQPTVAYFSAEYAIADDMPIYAGGLGVLAADMVLEAAAENRPFVALGLVYHLAFTGSDPDQRPMSARLTANGFEVAKRADGSVIFATVHVAERAVAMQAWVKSWGETRLVLLDTNLSQNAPADRAICDRLYAADPSLQLAQEICLGFGGVAMLEELKIQPDVYHLNEGHTALAGLALVLRTLKSSQHGSFAQAVAESKPHLVGTKHTILAGAGILLDWGSVTHQLEPMLKSHGATIDQLKEIAGLPTGDYSDTRLMIELTRLASGVSKIHVAEELVAHPESKLITITNGVFRGRWLAENWGDNPMALDDATIWAKHAENRKVLFDLIREQTGCELDPEMLTVVWARRMAAYKRPEVLVSDLGKLAKLAHHADRPVQFVVAGRANPADMVGTELMKRVMSAAKNSKLAGRFAYLPYYNPASARRLVQGADVWLNTPIRGYEACGTSGMKASMNGAVQLSVSDGWIDEVDVAPIGWKLPSDQPGPALYSLLQHEIAPAYYQRDGQGIPAQWVKLMRANMHLALTQFTATRMLADYYEKLYKN